MKNQNKPKRAVVVLSGGLDSAVALAVAKKQGYDLFAIFFTYGQKTVKKESGCVRKLVQYYKVTTVKTIALPWLKDFGGSALLDPSIPLDEKNFLKEYVPFRNSQFLAIATAWAEVLDARAIFVGSSGGDHICPDNSKKYLASFQKVIREGTMINKKIIIKAPLINTDKTGAVKIGNKLHVPFQYTWSCHNNITKACGHCSNCLSRLEAFTKNDLKDPISYI